MTEKQAVWNALKTEVEFFTFLVENTSDKERIATVARNVRRYCDQLDEIEAAERMVA